MLIALLYGILNVPPRFLINDRFSSVGLSKSTLTSESVEPATFDAGRPYVQQTDGASGNTRCEISAELA